MITKPTLFLDKRKCKKNIYRMFSKAHSFGLAFRPHLKTHQSLDIGKWFKQIGTKKITVSSVTMAEYFSSDWNDITIAFPTNILEINRINDLAKRITLNLLIENEESVLFLTDNLKSKINVFIKIDVGYNRTGIDPTNTDLIDRILNIINTTHLMTFKGFLGHAGQTYECRTKEDIIQVHRSSLDIMAGLKTKYLDIKNGYFLRVFERVANVVISSSSARALSLIPTSFMALENFSDST